MGHLSANYALPELGKSFSVVGKFKRFDLCSIRAQAITNWGCLPNVNRNNQTLGIDETNFFCFNPLHGYTPFPLEFTNLPAG
jgi:hypothetical protein